MKKIFIAIAIFLSVKASAQTDSRSRDSVAQTGAFQVKVKMASHKAANNLLADPLTAARVRQYAQLVVSEPNGPGWLPALSYGCMTNVAINSTSTDSDIEFTVNSIFSKYAYAYYRDVAP